MNDREDEGQEEGEYHFSDDQVNYDMESETPGTGAAALKPPSIFSKITTRHKIMMAIVVVAILLSIVIKIMVPTKPPTDFVPATAPVVTATPPKATAPLPNGQVTATKPAATASTASRPLTAIAENGSVPTTAPSSTEAPATTTAAGPAPSGTLNPNAVIPQNTLPNTVANTTPATINTPVTPLNPQATTPTSSQQSSEMAPSSSTALQPTETTHPPTTIPMGEQTTPTPTQNVLERLATVEQQNAAIVNLLQTEYAQKLADSETNATAARGKMEELTKRLNRLEASINQLTQALQAERPTEMGGAIPARAAPPHIGFTVQAIIPGRAWLKSESGETVTVAEGDILRDYGRITKIDPYDGIVNIDTGNRVVTLSYGMTE